MTDKRLICRQRLRTLPSQFSWLDQRLVRDYYIDQCDVSALALYLFLVTVADARGLSYYVDATLSTRLSLPQPVLQHARQSLIATQLIAYQAPLYRVLALPDAERSPTERSPTEQQTTVNAETPQRSQKNRPLALAELLKLASANSSHQPGDTYDD